MSTVSRLGAVVAASALASDTALVGAGMAIAAESDAPDYVFDSPSSVSISGAGEDVTVTYTNKSEHDLMCMALVGPEDFISKVYSMARSGELDFENDVQAEEVPEGFGDVDDGQYGVLLGDVAEGDTAELKSAAEYMGVDISFPELTDDSFTPGALTFCIDYELLDGEEVPVTEYAEVEVTPGIGVPGFLGSLDAGLAGIGSSGSVANVSGSLGS